MTKEERAMEFIGIMEQFIKLRTSMFNDDIDSSITSKAIPFVIAHDDAIRREWVDWVDKLYDVRTEPDKLIIMIVNKHYQVHRPGTEPAREGA